MEVNTTQLVAFIVAINTQSHDPNLQILLLSKKKKSSALNCSEQDAPLVFNISKKNRNLYG